MALWRRLEVPVAVPVSLVQLNFLYFASQFHERVLLEMSEPITGLLTLWLCGAISRQVKSRILFDFSVIGAFFKKSISVLS